MKTFVTVLVSYWFSHATTTELSSTVHTQVTSHQLIHGKEGLISVCSVTFIPTVMTRTHFYISVASDYQVRLLEYPQTLQQLQ